MIENKIDLKFTKDQYDALIKLLYFADYCVSNRLISEFDNSELRESLSGALETIYKQAANINASNSISLHSLASEVPFSEEEVLRRRKMVEADLERISKLIFANEFAKKELHLPDRESIFDYEGGWESKTKLIYERMQPYFKEFNENGISNLRFKLFHSLPTGERD